MQINQAGLSIIRTFEGCKLKAYQDTGGIWTIGYGHTGPDVKPGLRITQEQAEDLLERDLKRFEQGVIALLPNPVSVNEFSALVSFAFNVGLDAFEGSTLRKKLRAGDDLGAADEFLRWVKDNGRTLAGLVRRRKAERFLFLTA